MPHYIDIHCHLDEKSIYPQVDDIITNAESAGVKIILNNGIDKETNRIALELAETYPIVKAALGIYPTDKTREGFDQKAFEEELKFIEKNRKKIVAIGEIGLDGKHVQDEALQEEIFRKQLKLAKKLDLPVIIHSRKAEQKVLDILEEEQMKKVLLHCFAGKKKLIKEGIRRKYYFSVPTMVVRAEQMQILTDLVPLNQLFAETDAPFLSPFKDKTNEPAFVVESYKKIAEIKQLTIEEVKNNLFLNWQRFS
jgi:TatD DNase family protein